MAVAPKNKVCNISLRHSTTKGISHFALPRFVQHHVLLSQCTGLRQIKIGTESPKHGYDGNKVSGPDALLKDVQVAA